MRHQWVPIAPVAWPDSHATVHFTAYKTEYADGERPRDEYNLDENVLEDIHGTLDELPIQSQRQHYEWDRFRKMQSENQRQLHHRGSILKTRKWMKKRQK